MPVPAGSCQPGAPGSGTITGLVETTWDDPERVLAASDFILRSSDCVAECAGTPQLWYERVQTQPCYACTRFWKFSAGGGCAGAFPMNPLGVDTFDGLFVRDDIWLQLYAGATDQSPYGPAMVGPQFVSIDIWRDAYPACEGFEPGTFFVSGGEGGLSNYSIRISRDGPIHTTASPTPARPADDRTFLHAGPGAPIECRCGTIELDIDVTRFAGPTNADGTLTLASVLKQNQLIGDYATLLIMAWDVDSSANEPGVLPEMDQVYFNGELVASLDPGNAQFLVGENGQWRLNSFRIPIEKVKFPSAPGPAGPPAQPPQPAANSVRIEIDVGNPQPVWCTAVDWAALLIDAMSPVILVHGITESAEIWIGRNPADPASPQFMDPPFAFALGALGLVWNNSIALEGDGNASSRTTPTISGSSCPAWRRSMVWTACTWCAIARAASTPRATWNAFIRPTARSSRCSR